jgi:hypothetical protein
MSNDYENAVPLKIWSGEGESEGINVSDSEVAALKCWARFVLAGLADPNVRAPPLFDHLMKYGFHYTTMTVIPLPKGAKA